MSWHNNPYRGARYQEYQMTPTQYATLFSFCCISGASNKEIRELCVEFWKKLGEQQGFDPWSVSRVNRRTYTFEAVPA
jgi:hypothetical protein